MKGCLIVIVAFLAIGALIGAKVRAALDQVKGGDLHTVMTATVNAYSDACRERAARGQGGEG